MSPFGAGIRSITASSSSVDAGSGLGRDVQHLARRDPEHALDLRRALLGLRGGQVDLVERGDDREVVLDRLVAVRERLRLDALRRVDEQDHALARGEAAAHLVAEVDVAGRVDEVDDVAVLLEPDVLGLDRDAPLALEVHRVEVLRAHVAGSTAPVSSSSRSASVDFPWSIWAMMLRQRMRSRAVKAFILAAGGPVHGSW